MNKVFEMGRLTRDPEIKYSNGSNGNICIANFSIAVNRRGKSDEADFFNCTAFGKLGEFVEKYLVKGSKIVLIGHLQQDRYKNKDGQDVSSIKIISDEIEFAESKKDNNDAAKNVNGVQGGQMMQFPNGAQSSNGQMGTQAPGGQFQQPYNGVQYNQGGQMMQFPNVAQAPNGQMAAQYNQGGQMMQFPNSAQVSNGQMSAQAPGNQFQQPYNGAQYNQGGQVQFPNGVQAPNNFQASAFYQQDEGDDEELPFN